jgi:hypothetical protein
MARLMDAFKLMLPSQGTTCQFCLGVIDIPLDMASMVSLLMCGSHQALFTAQTSHQGTCMRCRTRPSHYGGSAMVLEQFVATQVMPTSAEMRQIHSGWAIGLDNRSRHTLIRSCMRPVLLFLHERCHLQLHRPLRPPSLPQQRHRQLHLHFLQTCHLQLLL